MGKQSCNLRGNLYVRCGKKEALFPVKTQTRIWAHMEEVRNALTLRRLKFGTIMDCEM